MVLLAHDSRRLLRLLMIGAEHVVAACDLVGCHANIEVAGHTDADGQDAANLTLSEKRAQAVVDYLEKAGLPASRFTALGYGSTQPVADNNTDEGKA